MRCSTRPVAVRWARDQGVVAKNLVHSNADQTSDWICILTPQMQMPKNDGNRWKQLERNLSPRKQKKKKHANNSVQCSSQTKSKWIKGWLFFAFESSMSQRFHSASEKLWRFLDSLIFLGQQTSSPQSRIHPEGFESSRIQNRHVVGGGPRYYHSGWRLSFLGDRESKMVEICTNGS